MTEHKTFELNFPIPRTLCGIPMGNGNFGAMVWGKDVLSITVNRADFWDHRGGETLMEGIRYETLVEVAAENDNEKLFDAFVRKKWPETFFKPQRIPVGHIDFILNEGHKLDKATLEYITGELIISTVSGNQVKLNLCVNSNLMVIDDKQDILKEAIIHPSWEYEQSREWLSKYAFNAPKIIEEPSIRGWIQPCPDDPSLASICKKVTNGYVLSLELGETNDAAFRKSLDSIDTLNHDELIENNRIWWRDFWKDVPEIHLPEKFFNRFYKYAVYKFAGATSPESPIPSGLQGPWIEEYHQAQWSGDYHFNVNIQQIYTLAFATGKLEHLMPLFDMLESEVFMNNMCHNAKVLFDIDDGLLLTHAVDDRGFQCGGISVGSTLDQACGAWTAQLYWFYYKYSGDKKFLRTRAFPFMSGVMRVYEKMLEEKDNRFSVPLAISAEYGCRNPNGLTCGRDPSYQFAAIHMLVNALLESCKILEVPPRPIWEEIKQKTPHFTVIENLDPYMKMEKRIAVWEGQDLEVCHRHHSHLGCIYPFDSLPKNMSDEMKEIVDNSIDHWILMGMGQWSEWCIPWATIIQSRLGFNEAPVVLLNMWKEIFINEGMTTVYLPRFRGIIAHRRHDMNKPKETHEVMQLDGTMGCATALLEMLAHHHNGTVRIFAGIPEKWKDVSFRNIHLPGPFLVDACRKDGKPEHVIIKSFGGKTIKIDVLGTDTMLLEQNGNQRQISLPENVKMEDGETVELRKVET